MRSFYRQGTSGEFQSGKETGQHCINKPKGSQDLIEFLDNYRVNSLNVVCPLQWSYNKVGLKPFIFACRGYKLKLYGDA